MSCSSTPVPPTCSAASKYWASMGTMLPCSSPQHHDSGCGMCSPSLPVWQPYGRDASGCPIVWCPQGCLLVGTSPSPPGPPAAIAPPIPPSDVVPAPSAPSPCAGGLFKTADSAASSACSPCPPGSFCPPGSVAPSPCPPGTASNYTGASSSTVRPNVFPLVFRNLV
jgi:hypothetical protein